jgi:hypothetical protein
MACIVLMIFLLRHVVIWVGVFKHTRRFGSGVVLGGRVNGVVACGSEDSLRRVEE